MTSKFFPKKAHFETKSQVAPNSLIFNHELTEPAKIFLLALNGIYSNTVNWIPIQGDIQKRLRWGQEKMEGAIKSAVNAGYLKVIKSRNNSGMFNPNEFEFDMDGGYLKNPTAESEEKRPEEVLSTNTGFPVTDVPVTDNPYIPCSSDLTLLSKKTTTANLVAVFSCLEKVDISDHEKQWICKNYTEKEVQHAVSYATNPNVHIKTSLIQTLKWACHEQPQIPLSKQQSEEENKKLAQELEKKAIVPQGFLLHVLNKHIEISFGGNAAPFVLDYNDSNFKEKLEEALTKYRILIK